MGRNSVTYKKPHNNIGEGYITPAYRRLKAYIYALILDQLNGWSSIKNRKKESGSPLMIEITSVRARNL